MQISSFSPDFPNLFCKTYVYLQQKTDEIMRKLYITLLIALAILPVSAQNVAQIKTEIDSLLAVHPLMRWASMGIHVYDATADTVLYSHDAKKLHRPASTTKLFTCATVLKNLGADYGIKTTISTTGKIHKHRVNHERRHVLEGDLYIKGNFDPAFSQADMDTLIMRLKDLEIDSISGNIYADLSMKDSLLTGYGWCWDDTGDDSPLLSPLVIDKDTCFISKFISGLQADGINVSGFGSVSSHPTEYTILAEKCRAISELLPQCLKSSDNRYAESFLYQLGNLNNKDYDSASDALFYVNQLIDSLGVDKHDYRLVDGSGLSFYNAITPETEVALLKYVLQESDFYEIFRDALPISGQDGTLKNRMKESPSAGKVYAKTGSLTGTYALAGYIYPENGHTYIFSLMNDGVPAGEGTGIRELQDQVLNVLCSY